MQDQHAMPRVYDQLMTCRHAEALEIPIAHVQNVIRSSLGKKLGMFILQKKEIKS